MQMEGRSFHHLFPEGTRTAGIAGRSFYASRRERESRLDWNTAARWHLELREFDHGRWQVHRLPKTPGPLPSASALYIDRRGTLWIGTASDGIYRTSGTVDHFTNADGLSSDAIIRFFEDREGVLWVASSKGIDSFRDLPVVSFSIKQGLISDSVSTVLASHGGGVWIGGAEGLGFLQGDRLSAMRTKDGFPGRDSTTMF